MYIVHGKLRSWALGQICMWKVGEEVGTCLVKSRLAHTCGWSFVTTLQLRVVTVCGRLLGTSMHCFLVWSWILFSLCTSPHKATLFEFMLQLQSLNFSLEAHETSDCKQKTPKKQNKTKKCLFQCGISSLLLSQKNQTAVKCLVSPPSFKTDSPTLQKIGLYRWLNTSCRQYP